MFPVRAVKAPLMVSFSGVLHTKLQGLNHLWRQSHKSGHGYLSGPKLAPADGCRPPDPLQVRESRVRKVAYGQKEVAKCTKKR